MPPRDNYIATTPLLPPGMGDVFEYPLGLSSMKDDSKYKALLHFQPITVKGLDKIEFGFEGSTKTEAVLEIKDAVTEALTSEDAVAKNIQPIRRTSHDPVPTHEDQQYCVLPLPQGVQLADGVQYANTELGVGGTAMSEALKGGADLLGAGTQALGAAAGGIVQGLKGNLGPDMGALIAQRLIASRSTAAADGIANATRVVANPNNRQLFKNVNLREFVFTFNMIPESPQEARMIQNIIYFFKENMMPEEIGVGQVAYGYKFPKMFKMFATYGEGYQNIMTDFLPCYLQSCNVTYNSAGPSFHEGGYFHDVQMSLSLLEFRPRNKQDVKTERSRITGASPGALRRDVTPEGNSRASGLGAVYGRR